MATIVHLLFGLAVGIVAQLLFPGKDPGGIIVTVLLGLIGAWVGGQLGRFFGWYQPSKPVAFLMAVLGAMLLLFVYHLAAGRKAMAG